MKLARLRAEQVYLKCDYVCVNPLPDAETVLKLIGDWIEHYNKNSPQSGFIWRSRRAFIKAKIETSLVSGETEVGSPCNQAAWRQRSL